MPPKSSAKPPSSSTKSRVKPAAGKPKQPVPTSERLKRLFASLCAQIDGGHFANAIKTCDKILRIDPNDADALQAKLHLFLQTEQNGAALSMLDAGAIGNNDAFLRAYALYRLNREDAARDALAAIKEDKGEDKAIQYLEAQLNYREGYYQEAFDVYNQLLDDAEPQSEEQSDILTNLQVAQQHLEFINSSFLHSLDELPTSLSTTIETLPPPAQPSTSSLKTFSAQSGAGGAGASAEHDLAKKPAKKVRMSRVPAGVVPGVTPPPDPERWLKKSERSTFGMGRKRKGAGGGGATQGSSALDIQSGAPGGAVSGHAGKSSGGGGKGKKKK